MGRCRRQPLAEVWQTEVRLGLLPELIRGLCQMELVDLLLLNGVVEIVAVYGVVMM